MLTDVEDERGRLPPGKPEELFLPFKGVRTYGGEIHVRDLPGSGCVFTVDLPRASPAP